MCRHALLIFPLIFLAGCNKEPPAAKQSPTVVVEPSAKKELDKHGNDAASLPPKEVKKTKLVTLDLRRYGIFAEIDVPADTIVANLPRSPRFRSDPEGAILEIGSIDLAKIKQQWNAGGDLKLKMVHIDEPDVLLAEFEEAGKPKFLLRINATAGGKPFHFSELFNPEKIDLAHAQRTIAWARTLRQTPELKAAQEQENTAISELRRLGAVFSTATSAVFANIPLIEDKVFELIQVVPSLESVSFINCGKLPKGFAVPDFPTNLRSISISHTVVETPFLNALGKLTWLEHLTLAEMPLTDVSFRSIINLKSLISLDVSRTRISDNGLRNMQQMKDLQSLDLTGTDVTGSQFVHLQDCKHLSRVTLWDTGINDATINNLNVLSSLEDLNLGETVISNASISTLAVLPNLKKLNLYGTNVTADVAAKLEKTKPVAVNFKTKNYDEKELCEPIPSPVSPPTPFDKLPKADGAAMVARFGGSITRDEEAEGKPIIKIDLSNSKVTDVDLGQLRELSSLNTLILDGCSQITDAGLPYLAKLRALEELSLRGTKVMGDGLVHLSKLPKLTRILLSPSIALTSFQLDFIARMPSLEIVTFTVTEPSHPKLRVLSRMAKLKEVNLGGVTMSNRKMDYVKGMKSLETLGVGRDGIVTDRGLFALKGLTELKALAIPYYQGSDSGLDHLRALENLATLELYGPTISDRGVTFIAALHNLQRLRLDRLSIGDSGMNVIRSLGKLIELSAVETKITDKCFDSLAEANDLEFADLSFTKVTDAGLKKLAKLQELAGLRLEGTSINGAGFKALEDLPRFNRLFLRDTKLNDAGLEAISKLMNLQKLDASKNGITNVGIAKLKGLRLLMELDLTDCPQVTDEVLPVLKEFYGLKRIVVKGTKLSDKSIMELRKAGMVVAN